MAGNTEQQGVEDFTVTLVKPLTPIRGLLKGLKSLHLLLLILGLFWVEVAIAAPPTGSGQAVVANTGGLNVRTSPAGPLAGQQSLGAFGTTTSGPMNATLNGTLYTWFNVNFGSGVDGWAASQYLDRVFTPSIDNVSPNPVTGSSSAQNLTVNGKNFAVGAKLRLKDLTNGGSYDKTPTSLSANRLIVSANFTTAQAIWSAQVINPGNLVSNIVPFAVKAPSPTPNIDKVSPSSLPASTSLQWFKVIGTNFTPGKTGGGKLRFTDPAGVTYDSTAHPERIGTVTSTEWNYQINNAGDVGTWKVQVINANGKVSNQYPFQVTATAPSVSLTPQNATVNEGAGKLIFTLTRADSTSAQTFYASTVQNQGFTNNGDYLGKLNEPVVFAAGQTQRPITVQITDDSAVEGDETFALIVQQLSSDPVTVFLASATFTIQDNDVPPAAQVCDYDHIVATAPASRFTDNHDGTVTDKATGLQWKRCSEGQTWNGSTCTGTLQKFTWQQALQRADGASYAGHSDWRLPNIKELASIVERACFGPAIDPGLFPATPSEVYWSSSSIAGGGNSAWIVNFGNSFSSNSHKGNDSHVRLVRGGQSPASFPLNDTGLDWWANSTTNNLTSQPAGYPGQDASFGRDATQDNDADGHAGFSFTKLDANGNALPAIAANWSCVRDNVTGLTWEIKTNDGGLRDKNWTYTWYNPDTDSNGGIAGFPDTSAEVLSDNCLNPARCDTDQFVADVNQAGLCGASDWRLPGRDELRSIVDYSRYNPAIDTDWFPDIGPSWWYWSSSPVVIFGDAAWIVNFGYGYVGRYFKGDSYHARLVRGGQASGTTLSLRGKISRAGAPLEGANLALTGTASGSDPSGPTGDYGFFGLANGSYSITPTLANHVFSPVSRTTLLAGASQAGLDFRACDTSLVLSGYVRDATTNNSPMVGVSVSAGGLSAITGPDGHYQIPGLGCGQYSVTVNVNGYASYQRTLDRFDSAQWDILLTKVATTDGLASQSGFANDPVNTATGNYVYQRRDLAIPGIGFPFQFDRSYNSRAASQPGALGAPLGYGWSHSYHLGLSRDGGGNVTIRWGDGHTETFAPDGGGGYIPQYGMFDTLTANGDGTYSLRKRNHTSYQFDIGGRLVAILDKNNNTLSLVYSGGNLTQVIDTAGRAIAFDYDSGGRLKQITDPIGRTIQYDYDLNGDLIAATDPDGGVTGYAYDGSHQILSVTDPRGHTVVTNTYDDVNRVVTYQTDAKGGGTSYVYQDLDRVTSITDALGQVRVHHHDELLRLVKDVDPLGGVMLFAYDAAGNRVQVTDRNGHLTQYGYDARGNVTSKTDALGQVTAISYDGDDNPISRTDALGHTTQFAYDAPGNLTQIIDALGQFTFIGYDPKGLPQTLTDPLGHVTLYAYDDEGNRVQVTDALGQVSTATFDGVGRRLSATDPLGHTTQYAFDGRDHLLSLTDALGGAVTQAYDANGNRISITDQNGHTTQFAYDVKDLLSSTSDALGGVESHAYDALDRRLSTTDRRGHTTQYAYDAVGNLVEVTDPLGNKTLFSYDLNGNRLSLTDARGYTTTFIYDELNRRIRTQDPLGNATDIGYDALGRVTSVLSPLGQETTNLYDALGRLTQVTDPDGAIRLHGYDANGNRISTTDRNGHPTQFGYDALNRLVRLTDALGHDQQIGYDALGNRTIVVDALGNIRSFNYDAVNRRIAEIDHLGHITTTAYDPGGRVTSTTDANGQVTAFLYDVLNRLSQVTDAAGGTLLYTYDPNGNRLSMTDPNGHTTLYAYDPLNRRIAITEPLGHVTSLVYDAVGNLSQRIDAKGQVTQYGYDARNRLTGIDYAAQPDLSFAYDAVGNLLEMVDGLGLTSHGYDIRNRRTSTTDPFGKVLGYGYDPNGNRTSLVYPDGRSVTYGYDAADRLTSVTDWLGRTTSYSYDAANRLIGTLNGNGTTASYGYDAASRLTDLSNATSDSSIINAYSYTLDPVGNQLSEDRIEALLASIPAGTVTDSHDAENRLIASNAVGNSFDANGNLVAKGANTYSFDAADRLVGTDIGGTLTQYQYDGLGNRYTRIRDGVVERFVLDTNAKLTNVLAETDEAGNIQAYNLYGLGLIARILPDDTSLYYHYDLRGSTIALSDASGAITDEYAYDPFGRLENSVVTNSQPFHFLGRHGVIDEGADLNYIRARYYDTEQQRFVSKDVKTGSDWGSQIKNRYVYVVNSPVILVDISGLSQHDAIVAINDSETTATNTTTLTKRLLLDVAISGTEVSRLANNKAPTTSESTPNRVASVESDYNSVLFGGAVDTLPIIGLEIYSQGIASNRGSLQQIGLGIQGTADMLVVADLFQESYKEAQSYGGDLTISEEEAAARAFLSVGAKSASLALGSLAAVAAGTAGVPAVAVIIVGGAVGYGSYALYKEYKDEVYSGVQTAGNWFTSLFR